MLIALYIYGLFAIVWQEECIIAASAADAAEESYRSELEARLINSHLTAKVWVEAEAETHLSRGDGEGALKLYHLLWGDGVSGTFEAWGQDLRAVHRHMREVAQRRRQQVASLVWWAQSAADQLWRDCARGLFYLYVVKAEYALMNWWQHVVCVVNGGCPYRDSVRYNQRAYKILDEYGIWPEYYHGAATQVLQRLEQGDIELWCSMTQAQEARGVPSWFWGFLYK